MAGPGDVEFGVIAARLNALSRLVLEARARGDTLGAERARRDYLTAWSELTPDQARFARIALADDEPPAWELALLWVHEWGGLVGVAIAVLGVYAWWKRNR